MLPESQRLERLRLCVTATLRGDFIIEGCIKERCIIEKCIIQGYIIEEYIIQGYIFSLKGKKITL